MFAQTSNCDRERLRQLLDGELAEAVQSNVVQHIETCVACQLTMESFAADVNWWAETRDALSGVSYDQNSYLSEEDTSPSEDAFVSTIPLDFLSPSDNPAMLGRLGEFEILEQIGCGGMGIVLKGYDHELNRFVAVKVLHPFCATSAGARRRFVREAQAAAAIVHQHVVAIHAVDANHHPPYLVMAFVPGQSLQQRLTRHGPLELLDGLRIGQQVAEGLAAAHAQGLVHRDIKPGNILLERNVERVLLTDFGLARAADDASLTRSGVIAGTPQYMSPEQARGDQVDHRTDLFSLGTVLYTIFAGHSPFRAESALAVLRRVCEDTPRPLREINPNVPDWLEAFIAKLHAKQPINRIEDADTVAAILRGALAHVQQPTLVPLPNEIKQLVKAKSKSLTNWAGEFVVLGTLIVSVLVGVFLFTQTGVRSGNIEEVESTAPSKVVRIEYEKWNDGVQNETDQVREQLERWESDSDF